MNDPIFDLFVLSRIAEHDEGTHVRATSGPASVVSAILGLAAVIVALGFAIVVVLAILASAR